MWHNIASPWLETGFTLHKLPFTRSGQLQNLLWCYENLKNEYGACSKHFWAVEMLLNHFNMFISLESLPIELSCLPLSNISPRIWLEFIANNFIHSGTFRVSSCWTRLKTVVSHNPGMNKSSLWLVYKKWLFHCSCRSVPTMWPWLVIP